MNDDGREVQHKSDRPAPSTSGITRPAVPARPILDEPEWGVDSAPRVSPASVAPAPVAPAPVAPAPVAPVRAGPAVSGAAGSFGYERRMADLDPQIDDLDQDEDEEYEDLPPTLTDRIRGLKPAPVILGVASIGSVVFLLRAMTSHTTPVPVLLSAGVVAALVFGIDAGVTAVAVFRSGQEGRTGRALLLALLGGFSALVGAGAFSGVLVMVLVLNS
jgi:hypothetical protein